MNIKIKALVIPLIIIYLLLAIMFSYTAANILILVIVGIISARLFFKHVHHEFNETNKAAIVPAKFKNDKNTLKNNFCIVRYFPNKKITIIENPNNLKKEIYRAFTVDTTNNEDVNKCWADICSFFDEYSNVNNLFSFIDKVSGRLNIKFFNLKEKNDILEGMEEFLPVIATPVRTPRYDKQNPKFKPKENSNQVIVDFEELGTQNVDSQISLDNQTEHEVIDMQDLTNSDKIDVNLANAETISSLPGINIIMAKKIVEYRDIHGFFKKNKDFIDVSEVKDIFKDKILAMITTQSYLSIPKYPKVAEEQERTVD